jgi:hypothetical protein
MHQLLGFPKLSQQLRLLLLMVVACLCAMLRQLVHRGALLLLLLLLRCLQDRAAGGRLLVILQEPRLQLCRKLLWCCELPQQQQQQPQHLWLWLWLLLLLVCKTQNLVQVLPSLHLGLLVMAVSLLPLLALLLLQPSMLGAAVVLQSST